MKDKDKLFKSTYPNMRYFMSASRNSYINYKNLVTSTSKRALSSTVVPDVYGVCNTNTIDSDFDLNLLEGSLPKDINGNMYICQCLGTKDAFMVGDTNLVKLNFSKGNVHLTNKMMWSPVSLAKVALQNSVHRFDHMGLMFMSPGLGMFSYTEGMYLLPDGRLSVTSDVDRPWIINRSDMQITTPLGTRKEWLPMMGGDALDVMGSLFAGYSNSHVIYTDVVTNELFLVNYQGEQKDKSHPCILMKWDGKNDLKKWNVVDEKGDDILIKQSIHELIFTKDYILLADTAFVTGAEILCPWKNSPLPNTKTIVYIVNRKDLKDNDKVIAKKIEIDEACIHLIANYENPNNIVTVYMLHTPATNTAEIIRSYDKNLNGKRFPKNLVGYGTLPVLDLSSIGKHEIDMNENKVENSSYIRDKKITYGPYMYTYMGRQIRNFNEQDLYVMFKGFNKDVLPKRIFNEYKDVDNRIIPIDELLSGNVRCNNSIARLNKDKFKIEDKYIFDDKVLLYTISCIEKDGQKNDGYVLAAVVRDVPENKKTSGHEYWLFDGSDLKSGPICKLGHKTLNNSVLFHTVYISDKDEKRLDKKEVSYHIDLKEDYPKKELKKWNPEVLDTFEKVIYPYFDSEKRNSKNLKETIEDFAKKRINIQIGYEHLLGEEELENPVEFANLMFDETKRMLKTTGWKIESEKNNVYIESKNISGPYSESKVLITRACSVLNINAKEFFEYITSPEGYAVIDPVSNPDDHTKKPLEVYKWKDSGRLEAANANVEIKALPATNFVVLNAIDNDELLFSSKSIIHNKMPGASKYIDDKIPENKKIRAINTFSIKVEEISKNKCRVLCLNYADMSGKTSPGINNFINRKAFFQGLYKRMYEYTQKK